MSNLQLFLALLGSMVTVFSLFAGFFKYYIDAKFETVNVQLLATNNQLKFLTEHFVEHETRISKLETK